MARSIRFFAFFVLIVSSCFLYSGCSGTPNAGTQAPSNLQITTASPLLGGTSGVAYSLQFAASGGASPYHWALASGSSLPSGLSLSAAGVLSGTPTTAGTSTFDIVATDSTNPAASVKKSFSLTIASVVAGATLLKGSYAFEFDGFNSTGAVVVAGSFQADGLQTISNGVEDSSTTLGHVNNAFTGSYTLGADNRGTLIFSSIAGSPTYRFAIDSTGTHGRFVEFDASGIRGSGQIEKQTVTTCGSTTLSGATGESYVFGVTGSASAVSGSLPGPVVLAGAFTAQPPPGAGVPGNLLGEADVNIPGITVTSPTTAAPAVTGTFQTTSQASFCSLTMQPSQVSSAMNFSVYPVSGTTKALTQAFVVETDTVSAATPYLTVGRLIQQCILVGGVCGASPFLGQTPGNFFTATSVGALAGQVLDTTSNSYLPDAAIAEIVGTGGTSFTMSVVENQAGTVGTFGSPFAANFGTLDANGRVATTLTSPFSPVLYVISANEALCIGQINNNPFYGIFLPQSAGPFTAATIKGTFLVGSSFPPTSTVRDLSGVVTFDGVNALSGTQDQSTSLVNTAGEGITGTYSITSSTAGSGTVTLVSPAALTGSFYVISPTQFVIVTTTTGDTNPAILIVGN